MISISARRPVVISISTRILAIRLSYECRKSSSMVTNLPIVFPILSITSQFHKGSGKIGRMTHKCRFLTHSLCGSKCMCQWSRTRDPSRMRHKELSTDSACASSKNTITIQPLANKLIEGVYEKRGFQFSAAQIFQSFFPIRVYYSIPIRARVHNASTLSKNMSLPRTNLSLPSRTLRAFADLRWRLRSLEGEKFSSISELGSKEPSPARTELERTPRKVGNT